MAACWNASRLLLVSAQCPACTMYALYGVVLHTLGSGNGGLHVLHACRASVLCAGLLEKISVHHFPWISFSSLPILKTVLWGTAGAEQQLP